MGSQLSSASVSPVVLPALDCRQTAQTPAPIRPSFPQCPSVAPEGERIFPLKINTFCALVLSPGFLQPLGLEQTEQDGNSSSRRLSISCGQVRC